MEEELAVQKRIEVKKGNNKSKRKWKKQHKNPVKSLPDPKNNARSTWGSKQGSDSERRKNWNRWKWTMKRKIRTISQTMTPNKAEFITRGR